MRYEGTNQQVYHQEEGTRRGVYQAYDQKSARDASLSQRGGAQNQAQGKGKREKAVRVEHKAINSN